MHGTEFTHNVSGIVKIACDELLPGMFVYALDRPWADSLFLPSGIHLKATEVIHILTRFCKSALIDIPRGAEPARLNRRTSLYKVALAKPPQPRRRLKLTVTTIV
jgi:hypothetical protein